MITEKSMPQRTNGLPAFKSGCHFVNAIFFKIAKALDGKIHQELFCFPEKQHTRKGWLPQSSTVSTISFK